VLLLDLMAKMMVKVKICGITNATDARFAAAAGADALGFVFVPRSARYIAPEKAAAIIADLPPLVHTVGVFVDQEPERVMAVAALCRLDYVQLHGRETPRTCEACRACGVIKAFRIQTRDDLRQLDRYRADACLLDTYVPDRDGGTGAAFDWEIARAAGATGMPVILAGGLNPGNAAQAVAAARPMAVDVSSGVEEAPGRKNKRLVEDFIRAAKSVDL